MKGYLLIISEEEKQALQSLLTFEEQIIKVRLCHQHSSKDIAKYMLYKNLNEKLNRIRIKEIGKK